MPEKKGRFEQGRWVEEPIPAAPAASETQIEERISGVSSSVMSAIDNVVTVTRDLVTTNEGKQYIEKTLKDTRTHIQKSFDDILTRAKEEVNKNVKTGKK
jgi:hypothetical protein